MLLICYIEMLGGWRSVFFGVNLRYFLEIFVSWGFLEKIIVGKILEEIKDYL